jgi:hypothetical protein
MNNEENNTIAPRKSVNLNICGGNHKLYEVDEIRAVPTPPVEFRKKENRNGERPISYQPVAHAELIDRTRTALTSQGFTIQDEIHSLACNDNHYFGLFAIDHANRVSSDRGCVVGIRNSHDKKFPAGLCAGDAPFVCDNLIFTNTIKLARRHTRNILDDLNFTINRALGKLFGFWNGQDARIEAYKNRSIGNVYANDLIVKAVQMGALPKTKLLDVVNQWESSDHPEFHGRNVNSLYNAFTEVYKGNLVQLPNRSDALHSLLDGYVDFKIDNHVEDVLDMEVVENELVEAF